VGWTARPTQVRPKKAAPAFPPHRKSYLQAEASL
jgi:hypothetical protein